MLSSFLSWWRGEAHPDDARPDGEVAGRRRARSPAKYLLGAHPGVGRYGDGKPTDGSHDGGDSGGSGWDGGGFGGDGSGGGADG